ncbi:TRAP transporter small permease [Paenalcaligenes niemegkensis]|uniref:TRAP transporter small permease n=1 Tax=Paenalcaligenes niemegkensis TaxID=2895469 RepID=UPI001EE83EBD|nr:TRAP transporter small permease [Paenalcaligenes niemegkensis]MCQ9617895.1 TRAP transporter small permease [Paenalcaligenes niemegkensis]
MSELNPATPAGFAALKQFLKRLDQFTYWIIVAMIGGMTILVALQVILRYFFGTSIDSADELSRLLFVWSIFIAIPHGVRHGVHVGIDVFVSLLPSAAREVIFRLTCVVSLLLMALVFLGAWTAVIERWPELMPTLPISSAVFYIPLLICAGHSFLHLLLLLRCGSKTWLGENL